MKRTILIITLIAFVGASACFLTGCMKKEAQKEPSEKTLIGSPSLLTDETTGKGVISLGDPIDQVKETLIRYEPSEGYHEITDYQKNEYGEWFSFGDAMYSFDTKGMLISFGSWSGGGPFETSKGLVIGDSVSKMLELYGSDYSFVDPYPSGLPFYKYTFENTVMVVKVGIFDETNPRIPKEGDLDAVVDTISCGLRDGEN